MKKITSKYIHVLAAFLLMAMQWSCGADTHKLLEGTWNLKKSTIPNLDSVVQVRSDECTRGLSSALEMVNTQLDTCKSEPNRSLLIIKKNELEKSIEDGSPENIKRLFEEQQKQLAGELNIIFGSDGKLVLFIGDDHTVESNTGAWTLQGDTIRTLFDNNPSENLIIRSISAGSLELESHAIDATGVDLILQFSKI